jgi:hypothetical protein
MSYYSYDRIVSLLRFSVEEYIEARDRLIEAELIAFDGQLFQVLSLPEKLPPASSPGPLKSATDMDRFDPATIGCHLKAQFGDRP